MSIDLNDLGYDEAWATHLDDYPDCSAARVCREDRSSWQVLSAAGPTRATAHESLTQSGDRPVVGDWVAVRGDVIDGVLPRRSAFVRHTAGEATRPQVLAANIDYAMLVVPLDAPPNLRRLERLLALSWESGAQPVVVLSKSDHAADLELLEARTAVEGVALSVAVHAVSARTGEGLDELADYVAPGRTVALLGTSGAGKSTLANALAGAELLATAEIRADGKGRHTTTRRELVMLPGGGVLIDTPGLRGVQLWAAEEGLATAFEDVESLTGACRFSDCAHDGEPGCAVLAAVAAGTLEARRLESYRKLQRELMFIARKNDARLRAEQSRKWRAISKQQRAHYRQ
jgi:ribosome biogenesis GTPase